MARKGSKPNGASGSSHHSSGGGKTEVLSAIVVADSFDSKFAPLSNSLPRCLMPMANVPLIEYTLEALSISGVDEVYIYCKSFVEKIRSYIEKSRWAMRKSSMRLKVEYVPSIISVGDILRDADAKGLISDTFLLVHSDLVCNIQLTDIIREHKKRAKEDSDAIMTTVMKPCKPFHRTRDRCEGAVFALDRKTGRILNYDPVDSEQSKKTTNFPASFFKKHPQIDVRFDLLDVQVDICSPMVLALFTENFDYQDMRKDFMQGVLTSDILGHSLFCHILSEGYVARAKTPHLYDSVSKDIMNRWTYPLVPDTNLSDNTCFSYRRGHIYKEENVILSRTSNVGPCVIIGSGTFVGENSTISNSVIGRNCRIGEGVVITGAYIWDECVIESKCTIDRSILAREVTLKSHSIVGRGCLLDSQVIIGSEVRLAPFSKISASPQALPDFSDSEAASESTDTVSNHHKTNFETGAFDDEIVGLDGKGFLWKDNIKHIGNDDDDYEEEDLETFVMEEKNEAAKLAGPYHDFRYNHADELVVTEDEESEGDLFEDSEAEAEMDVSYTLTEVNAIKMSTDAKRNSLTITYLDCLAAVVPAVLSYIKPNDITNSTTSILQQWGGVIGRFVGSKSEQLEVIKLVFNYCLENKGISKAIWLIFYQLYDQDILEEESIQEWYNAPVWGTILSEPSLALRSEVQQLIDWFENASEEEEDDEDEED